MTTIMIPQSTVATLEDFERGTFLNTDQYAWISELRSGNRQQTSDTLRGKDASGGYTFCCLGVAEEVYCEAKGIKPQWVKCNYYSTSEFNLRGWSDAATLRPSRGKALRLDGGDMRMFASLNDTFGLDFEQIANVAEHMFLDGSISPLAAAVELGYVDETNDEITWSVGDNY
jgi:hypothetical protein